MIRVQPPLGTQDSTLVSAILVQLHAAVLKHHHLLPFSSFQVGSD